MTIKHPVTGSLKATATKKGKIVAVVADRPTGDKMRQFSRFTGRETCFTPSHQNEEGVDAKIQKAIFEIAKAFGQTIARSEAPRTTERKNICH